MQGNRYIYPLTVFLLFCSTSIFLLSGCQDKKKPAEPSLFQSLDSTQTNIGFVNILKDSVGFSILDYLYFYNGAGVAAGDINNDGLTDLFFVSNQGKNKLYLNQGSKESAPFHFQDITAQAGIEGFADWKTGVTMADVNGDGWLDIYVCAVGNFKGLEGSNELYINNGAGPDGSVTFTEKAADYGLDFTGFSTQAAFFDYDKDGDLDMYLLNHAVHTSRSYDRVSTRQLQNKEAGDYLYENQLISPNSAQATGKAIKFKDVSAKAGIYQAAMGYGLGIVVADVNNDGWEDIYVSNDFHEDDYYYINNHDGTFTESVKEHFRHLSRFSMGLDIADINNDGFQDIMTLDMYPEDETVEKLSAGEDPFDIYLFKLQYGYFNQYSRNCLQLNLSGQKFSEIGSLAGVAATDWSWSPLLADYDNDGIKDLFVSNGIVKRPNNLDYIKFATTDSMRYAIELSKNMDQKAIALMPEGKVHNYLFKGTQSLRFEDKSLAWGFDQPTISNGALYADLDNDGDLDLVTNNINEPAGVYRNNANQLLKNNYLKVKLKGAQLNSFGVGAKVILKSKGGMQIQQLMPTRGFLSSVEPVLNFGIGKQASIDTLMVIWENQQVDIQTNVKANSTVVIKQSEKGNEANLIAEILFKQASPLFEDCTSAMKINYSHQENAFFDFHRESLMPFQVSMEGPKIAVGDVNGDGLDDFYVGGAKWQAGKLMIQKAGNQFVASNEKIFQADSTYEDVDAAFFDADNDGDLDLYVVSGGNEFYGQMIQQFDRLYLNKGKDASGQPIFSQESNNLPPMFDNKSCVKPADFDKDGDMDLFVGGRVVANQYGQSPRSYLLVNDGKGKFTDKTDLLAPTLRQAGMTTDANWVDYDKDGDLDLFVVGDWMPIRLFENQQGKLAEITNKAGLEQTKGLWQTIKSADFDKDGDIDFVVGNLGTNTKFRRRENSHLRMYVKDIDGNGNMDQVLVYNVGEKWFPIASKDELGKQMPLINKKFTTYEAFAGKTLDELFSLEEMKGAEIKEVQVFESVYLENLGNKQFKTHILPVEAQFSKIFAFHIEDADHDGNLDVLLGGNFYGVSTYQGRYDASYGLMLKGDGKGHFKSVLPTDCGFLLDGQVRDIQPLKTSKDDLLMVARNNQPLQLFRHRKANVMASDNPLRKH